MRDVNIQELISGKGFIMVNKGLAKAVGLTPATIYGELVSTFLYWKDRGQLTIQDGKEWFFCTIEDLEDKTTVKKDVQSKSIKVLEKEGLIESKRFGLPAKRYFHITDKYIEILIGNYISQKPKTDSTNVPEGKNDDKPRHIQISQKPKTTIRENRKQDFVKTDTNKKELNKKELNKREEEEKDLPSELVSFLLPRYYHLENILKFENRLLKEGVTGYTYDDVIKAIDLSLIDCQEGICSEPFIWAVGKLERLMDSKSKAGIKKPSRKPNKSIRTEMLPDWFDETKQSRPAADEENLKDKKDEIERMIQQLRG